MGSWISPLLRSMAILCARTRSCFRRLNPLASGLAPELSRTAVQLSNALEEIGLTEIAATIRVDETECELDSVREQIDEVHYWIERL